MIEALLASWGIGFADTEVGREDRAFFLANLVEDLQRTRGGELMMAVLHSHHMANLAAAYASAGRDDMALREAMTKAAGINEIQKELEGMRAAKEQILAQRAKDVQRKRELADGAPKTPEELQSEMGLEAQGPMNIGEGGV